VIGAYFIGWGIYARDYQVTNLPAPALTHVFYAFARPVYEPESNRFALVSLDPWADYQKPFPGDTTNDAYWGNFNQLRKLKLRFPHLCTLISAGGWEDSDAFSDIAASSTARLAFAESCVAFITNYGFDGLDLDWEYPVEGGEDGLTHRPEDADNLVLLAAALRGRLDQQEAADGRPYLLTLATSADVGTLTNRFHLAALCPHLDWVNVMTYDMAGDWDPLTGHLAPLDAHSPPADSNLCVKAALAAHLRAGVPPDQLVVGFPFYGRSFTNVPPAGNGLFQTHDGTGPGTWEGGILDFRDLRARFINTNGYVRWWDAVAGAPYLYSANARVFVTYDDEQSVQAKAEYARTNGLRGAMCWSSDADTPDRLLQRTIYRTWHPAALADIRPWTAEPASAVALGWDSLAGEGYRVECVAALAAGTGWTNAATLVTTSGVPAGALGGADGRLTLLDTNAAAVSRRFYRLRLVPPSAP
jgi:chitinase